ncbi:MAG: pirin family protein [Propionibacteriales bacterium]|nr:pirin family protein [Propionibacteriales bacterium]
MSNLERDPQESLCGGRAGVAAEPVRELLSGREVVLGGARGMRVTRTLPSRERRMVGAWCFVDQFGPEDLTASSGMRVPPHPHMGLQTVTWLVEGEVMHRDSLGSHQLIRPGQLNLMTAGEAISHSKETPPEHSPALHGVQLWVALPERHRAVDPAFEHHAELPTRADTGVTVTTLMGDFAGAVSPARIHSPLVGAEVAFAPGADTRLPLDPAMEYAVLALSGEVEIEGVRLGRGPLLYLGRDRSDLAVSAGEAARVLFIGGEPFEEQIVMWWNFVGRSHEDIVRAREDWPSRPVGSPWNAGPRSPMAPQPTCR